MATPTITLHRKEDDNGWQRVKTGNADDALIFTPQERGWIQCLLRTGDTVLKIGNEMYELHHERKQR